MATVLIALILEGILKMRLKLVLLVQKGVKIACPKLTANHVNLAIF